LVIAVENRYDGVYNGSDDEEEIELELEQKWSQIRESILPSEIKS